jgi:hypothetical protein
MLIRWTVVVLTDTPPPAPRRPPPPPPPGAPAAPPGAAPPGPPAGVPLPPQARISVVANRHEATISGRVRTSRVLRNMRDNSGIGFGRARPPPGADGRYTTSSDSITTACPGPLTVGLPTGDSRPPGCKQSGHVRRITLLDRSYPPPWGPSKGDPLFLRRSCNIRSTFSHFRQDRKGRTGREARP